MRGALLRRIGLPATEILVLRRRPSPPGVPFFLFQNKILRDPPSNNGNHAFDDKNVILNNLRVKLPLRASMRDLGATNPPAATRPPTTETMLLDANFCAPPLALGVKLLCRALYAIVAPPPPPHPPATRPSTRQPNVALCHKSARADVLEVLRYVSCARVYARCQRRHRHHQRTYNEQHEEHDDQKKQRRAQQHDQQHGQHHE